MKLPFVEKVAKKFTQTASEQVKKEAKKTFIDILPGLLTLGTMIFSVVVFHERKDIPKISSSPRPYSSTTKITTNNYFLGNVSDEIIKKVLEDR